MNENVDMSLQNIHLNPDKEKLKKTELYMPMFPLKEGVYTDGGFRLRKNIFSHISHWLYQNEKLRTFYDIQLFNHDTFEVHKDFNYSAQIYFRLHSNELFH